LQDKDRLGMALHSQLARAGWGAFGVSQSEHGVRWDVRKR